jgi:hypothetical protein
VKETSKTFVIKTYLHLSCLKRQIEINCPIRGMGESNRLLPMAVDIIYEKDIIAYNHGLHDTKTDVPLPDCAHYSFGGGASGLADPV